MAEIPTAPSTGCGLPIELQLWLSPSFPVGSFAYSHGLEWAVAEGRVRGRADAEAWLADLLGSGGPHNDAILLAEAWRAMQAGDIPRLRAVNELALALAGSRERYLETRAQGDAFLVAIRAAWEAEPRSAAIAALDGATAYPVAVGAVAAASGHPLAGTVRAFLAAQASSLVSALVRLAAVGQTDGQRILAALVPTMVREAEAAAASTTDDLGGAALISDIAAIAHETQDTRMFRT